MKNLVEKINAEIEAFKANAEAQVEKGNKGVGFSGVGFSGVGFSGDGVGSSFILSQLQIMREHSANSVRILLCISSLK